MLSIQTKLLKYYKHKWGWLLRCGQWIGEDLDYAKLLFYGNVLNVKYNDKGHAFIPYNCFLVPLNQQLFKEFQNFDSSKIEVENHGIFLSSIEKIECYDSSFLLTYAAKLKENLYSIVEIICESPIRGSEGSFITHHFFARTDRIFSRGCYGMQVLNYYDGDLNYFYCCELNPNSKHKPVPSSYLKLLKIEPLKLINKPSIDLLFSESKLYSFRDSIFSININIDKKIISLSSSAHDEGPDYARGYNYYWHYESLNGSSLYRTINDMVDAIDLFKKVFNIKFDSLSLLTRSSCTLDSILNHNFSIKTHIRPELSIEQAYKIIKETGINISYSDKCERQRND